MIEAASNVSFDEPDCAYELLFDGFQCGVATTSSPEAV
jgi:hypothetical protein